MFIYLALECLFYSIYSTGCINRRKQVVEYLVLLHTLSSDFLKLIHGIILLDQRDDKRQMNIPFITLVSSKLAVLKTFISIALSSQHVSSLFEEQLFFKQDHAKSGRSYNILEKILKAYIFSYLQYVISLKKQKQKLQNQVGKENLRKKGIRLELKVKVGQFCLSSSLTEALEALESVILSVFSIILYLFSL